MAVSFSDLQLAFEFVSSGGMGENEAYLDRQSDKIYWHSEVGDNDEELPDDIDDERYISIPDKRELDLGKPLVLDFAREFVVDEERLLTSGGWQILAEILAGVPEAEQAKIATPYIGGKHLFG